MVWVQIEQFTYFSKIGMLTILWVIFFQNVNDGRQVLKLLLGL